MRVLLDTNALIYLLDKRASQHIQDRLKGMLEDVEKSKGQVIIPAPVIAEYLVNFESGGGLYLLPSFKAGLPPSRPSITSRPRSARPCSELRAPRGISAIRSLRTPFGRKSR